MPPEIFALIEKPHLLFTVLLIGGLIGVAVEQISSNYRKHVWRQKNQWRWKKRPSEAGVAEGPRPFQVHVVGSNPIDTADQLRIVMAASFEIRPLLNKSEARLFKELDRIVIDRNPTWQVMAQVSLGEILSSKSESAYRCINSKRVDLLLMDENCRPRHAIEYQGGAHYQKDAAARDAVKKEALRRAGIGYHEVMAGHTTPSDLKRLIEKIVDGLTESTPSPLND